MAAIVLMALTACGSFEGAGSKVSKAVTPYKMDVIQGNVVTREQAAVLRPGMQRAQVRDVLGSSLLASVFHADRWDYVFTLKRQGAEPQSRKLTVFFKGDVLDRVESDELPSESEFVATLKSNPNPGPLPALEATDASLKKNAPSPGTSTAAPAVTLPAAPASYPPLEPAGN
jgi:outer membrane protein assembly factor BamE